MRRAPGAVVGGGGRGVCERGALELEELLEREEARGVVDAERDGGDARDLEGACEDLGGGRRERVNLRRFE